MVMSPAGVLKETFGASLSGISMPLVLSTSKLFQSTSWIPPLRYLITGTVYLGSFLVVYLVSGPTCSLRVVFCSQLICYMFVCFWVVWHVNYK